MRNNRGLFIFASAIIWSGAIYGISNIKPSIMKTPTHDGPVIGTTPVDPPLIPPPPPPPVVTKKDEKPIKQRVTTERKSQTELVLTNVEPPQIVLAENTDNELGDIIEQLPPSLGDDLGKTIEPLSIEDICKEAEQVPLPRSVFNVERAYPEDMLEKNITGTVRAVWQIDKNGLPERINIASSSNQSFNNAVVREGMKMRFKPARKECENIHGTYALNVVFELNEQ